MSQALRTLSKRACAFTLTALFLQGCGTIPPGGFVYDIPLEPKVAGEILRACYTSKPPVLNRFGVGAGAKYSFDTVANTAKLEIFSMDSFRRVSDDSFWGSRINHDIVVTPNGTGSRVEITGPANVTPKRSTFDQMRPFLDGKAKC